MLLLSEGRKKDDLLDAKVAAHSVWSEESSSIGALFRTYPLRQVKSILKRSGKSSIRERLMPNHIVVYYVLMLALFMTDSYREVMRRLIEGLQHGRRSRDETKIVSKSAISQARSRLGYEPFKKLYEEMVRPIAQKSTKGAWYKKWLLVSFDGSTLDVADTPENVKEFGKHQGNRGPSAFPKLRFVSLIESGTRVLFGAAAGPYAGKNAKSEMDLAWQVIGALRKGMLCLADRYYLGFEFWKAASETGADLIWRVKSCHILVPKKRLADGSYLTTLYPSQYDRKKDRNGLVVRVVEYRFKWQRKREIYRLVTTILDHLKAPAIELAALYHERWEIETVLSELKTRMRGAGIILRSKCPALVLQEFYAFLLAYFSVRGVIHEAALRADEDPDRLSFLHAVRVLRRKLPAFKSLPRRRWNEIHESILKEILDERVEERRHRRNHRGVKRKMSNYPLVNRSSDCRWRAAPSQIIGIVRPTRSRQKQAI